MVETLNQASQIARDAKGLLQTLKDAVKTREPWDREIEFQRQNLRRQYLQLLLSFPYAPQSQNIDNHLWIETSHTFISSYRQRIMNLERAISAQEHSQRGNHGPVEFRKLVSRFRQFLAEEERFWGAFALRCVRSFALDEAKPALLALSIIPPESQSNAEGSPTRPRADSTRNQFPEEGNPTPPPAAQREKKLLIVLKALVILGDLARYREMYNDSGGRPRAGKDVHDEQSRKGRGGRKNVEPRPRNFKKAHECYDQARNLFPDAGNASHQLAILASYEGDSFISVFHYYRSLCVRQPFPTASENLEKTLTRAYDGWMALKAKGELPGSSDHLPRVRAEKLKKDTVVLHALWRLDSTEREDMLPSHTQMHIQTFHDLIAELVIPDRIISQVVVLSLGALWSLRVIRDRREGRRANVTTEPIILTHILDLARVQMQIGIDQATNDARISNTPTSNVSAMAAFRRTLPSLRILSKWLKANLDYVLRTTSQIAASDSTARSELSKAAADFWKTFAEFATIVTRVFPPEQLPSMTVALEEDEDMRGFAPLKKSMYESLPRPPSGTKPKREEHPNQEHLMRIWDLLQDVKFIGELETTPLRYADGKFTVAQQITSTPTILARPPDSNATSRTQPPQLDVFTEPEFELEEELNNDIDDSASVSTQTEDDPVNLAMRATLSQDEDDEEFEDEEPVTPDRPGSHRPFGGYHPQGLPSPTRSTQPVGTTAQDLLLSVLAPRTPTETTRAQPHTSSSSPPLLFGSNGSSSIWSTSHDSNSFAPARAFNPAPPQHHQTYVPSSPVSSWGTSHPLPVAQPNVAQQVPLLHRPQGYPSPTASLHHPPLPQQQSINPQYQAPYFSAPMQQYFPVGEVPPGRNGYATYAGQMSSRWS